MEQSAHARPGPAHALHEVQLAIWNALKLGSLEQPDGDQVAGDGQRFERNEEEDLLHREVDEVRPRGGMRVDLLGEKIAPEAGQECFARPALISGEDKKGEQQVASDPHRGGALAEGEERPEEIARRLVVRTEELPRRVGQSAHRR
jgi:hypothetical protein